MITLTYNSAEFLKANVWIAQDGSKVTLRSEDVCYQENPDSRDAAWNEALEWMEENYASKSVESELEDDGNNGSIMSYYFQERKRTEDGLIEA